MFHHLFHIIITCISFDSPQFSRYFIYFDVKYAANEDWPRVYVAKILLRFGIKIVLAPNLESALFVAGNVYLLFVWLN